MGKNYKPSPWLVNLTESIPGSISFYSEMNNQLKTQFLSFTGLNLEKEFILLQPAPDAFEITYKDEKSIIEGDLVGSCMGYRVIIGWRIPGRKEKIYPSEDISDKEIQFWWEYIPVTDIITEENKKYAPLFDKDQFDFKIEPEVGVWPHLKITYVFEKAVTREELLKYENLLADLSIKWNEKKMGSIHSVSHIIQTGEKSLAVQIDFGSAGKPGLKYVLENSSINSNKLIKVYITNY